MNDIMIKHIAVSSHNREAKLTMLLNKTEMYFLLQVHWRMFRTHFINSF